MARIPIGIRYDSNLEGELLARFVCRSCKFEGMARVKSKGEGDATAYAFIGRQGARARAAEAAQADLAKNAANLVSLAPCPSCFEVDKAAVADVRSAALLKS